MQAFSTRFASIMAEQHLKDAPLARAIGISHTTVKRIRTGESEPTAGIVAAFALHTGVNAHWLLTGEGKPYIMPEDIPPGNTCFS